MTSDDAARLLILLILLILSAFFSYADTALTMVNRIRLQELAEEAATKKKALAVLSVVENRTKRMLTLRLGSVLANCFFGVLAASFAFDHFGNPAVLPSAVLVVLLVFLPGELMPKALAASDPEGAALSVGGSVLILSRILTPLLAFVSGLCQALLTPSHTNLKEALESMTSLELRTIVDVSHHEGVIEEEEREMIHNVVDFGDAQAKDVMVPRADMVTISETASYEEIRAVFEAEKYTRLPVYREDQANITGILNIKDFFFCDQKEDFKVTDIMYEPYFTYEYKKTSELLVEMRQNSVSISIVLDEYGASVGMISLEDLLEEIVGEIRDEYDEDEKDLIQKLSDREYQIEGSVRLDDINDALGLSLSAKDYDSIGGLIIEKLDHVPEEQESVTTEDGISLTVLKMEKNRIDLVQMILPEAEKEPEAQE